MLWVRSIRWPCHFRCGRPCHRARWRRKPRRNDPPRGRKSRARWRSTAAALGGPFDLVEPAAMSGGGVDRAIGGLGKSPNDGLIAGEQGIDFGGEGEAPLAAQRETVEASTDEIRIGVQFPCGSAAGEGGGGERRSTEPRHMRRWRMERIIPLLPPGRFWSRTPPCRRCRSPFPRFWNCGSA